MLERALIREGTVATVLDSQYGSTAKGVVSAYVTKNSRPKYLITANGRNSSHTVVDGDRKVVFKVLPCGAFYNGHDGYRPQIYIGPGAAFQVQDLFSEMETCGLTEEQVWIHPNASIVTEEDIAYENGLADFSGNPLQKVDHGSGTTAHGTTGSGSGAARAKKSLRKGLIASQVTELIEMITRPDCLIHDILQNGETGLLDGSQGFLLSLYGKFYPHTTSRAVTLAGFFADCDLPLSLLGDVFAVARTYPIRIASQRFFHDGKFLKWDEVLELRKSGIEPEVIASDSGGWYKDQTEISWDSLKDPLGVQIQPELTTLTKLPRRIATWSREAFSEFVTYNTPPVGNVHLFLTFVNYLGGKSAESFLVENGIRNMQMLGDIGHVFVSDGPQTDSFQNLAFSA